MPAEGLDPGPPTVRDVLTARISDSATAPGADLRNLLRQAALRALI
jgi:hypothetical protein